MSDVYDLAVVGYGPTGMVLAALAGQRGHRVVVLEKHRGLYNLPRAACFDDEIMRTFQKLGVQDEVALGAVAQLGYDWVNAAGETLVELTYPERAAGGWPALFMMYQPHVETVLDRLCKGLPSVDVRQGVGVTDLEQDPDGVTLTGVDRDGQPLAVRARWVVGADGGASFVRRKLGIGGSSYDFEENWLVCDFAKRRPLTDVPTFRQVCDPAQPTSIVRIGPDHHRFSFMLEPDETPESATDPGRVWQRVSRYLGPEDAELIRVANYVFRSRVADTWRRGRVLLAGDAAHEMPPFLAQGMCSGMRDAHNIAWKLDLVLTGRAEADLLDSYQPEREPHVRFITEKAIALGRVQTLRDPELARERDERLLAQRAENQTPERLRFPNLTGGLVDPGTAPQDAGAVWPQDRVARDGTAGRWDDVAGQGLQLVLAGRATLNELDQAQRDAWTALGGITIVLGQDGAQDAGVVDVDGSYAAWMAERECDAVVVRPDWYTYGTARGPKELGRLLDGLSAAMRPGRSAAAEI